MSDQVIPCPLCAALMSYDPEDGRWECRGVVQHCFVDQGEGADRELLLTASSSGEDAELFSTYPFPRG
jgi:hypothetical protein